MTANMCLPACLCAYAAEGMGTRTCPCVPACGSGAAHVGLKWPGSLRVLGGPWALVRAFASQETRTWRGDSPAARREEYGGPPRLGLLAVVGPRGPCP